MSGSATFAYVVMSHHKPEQALRLARTIQRSSPGSRVLLRHDVPGLFDVADARAAGADVLASDISARWGHWSLVEATLEAFAHVRDLHRPDWTVLISGQDYPVRDLRSWEDEVLASGIDAIVAGEPFVFGPVGWRVEEDADWYRVRYTHRWRWMPRMGVAPRLPSFVVRAARAAWLRRLRWLEAVVVLNELPGAAGWALGIRRGGVPFSADVPGYMGEQCMALSRAAVTAAVETDAARRWQAWYRSSLVPDEGYFPTVLAHAAGICVQRTGVSYQRWHEEVPLPHPIDITVDVLPEAASSGRPFARKFDRPEVLDAADRLVFATPAGG